MIISARKRINSRPKTISLVVGYFDFRRPHYHQLAHGDRDCYKSARGRNHMIHRVRLGFRNASVMGVLTIGEKVLTGMSGNPSFPDPPASMEILEQALDEFSLAIQSQATGGSLAAATRNNARRKVMELLSRLARYVEDKSNNDLPTLLSSGFPARHRSRAQVQFPKALILNITRRRSGELNLQVRAIPNARCYQVVYTEVGPDWRIDARQGVFLPG